MKRLILIWVVIWGMLLSGCSSEENPSQKDLSFDININNLSYILPEYTKICIPNRKQYCTTNGCEDIKPTVFVLYDENNNMVYRCDNNPCDGYEVTSSPSGMFTNITPVEPRGLSVKIADNGEYTESATLGLDTLISYGTCK